MILGIFDVHFSPADGGDSDTAVNLSVKAGDSAGGCVLVRQATIDGVELPERIPLQGDTLTLGRKEGATIVIPFKGISSKHCEFSRSGATYKIKDLNSTNGVRVNGEKVSEAVLKFGDTIALDQVVYAFEAAKKPAGAPAGAKPGARLVVEAGTLKTKMIPLTGTTVTFGRKPGNTVIINDDNEISGGHARITYDAGAKMYVVEDLGSTNGTSVDGRKLGPNTPVKLRHGMVITMGATRLRLEDPATVGAARPPRPQSTGGMPAAKAGARPSARGPATAAAARGTAGAAAPSRARPPAKPAADNGELKLDEPDGELGELDLDADGDLDDGGEVKAAPPPPDAAEFTDDELKVELKREASEFLSHHASTKRRKNPLQMMLEGFFVLVLIAGVVFIAVGLSGTGTTEGPVDASVRVPVPQGSLLTENHSFETEDEGDPVNWYLVPADDGDYARVETGTAREGGRCLVVQKSAPNYIPTACYSDQAITVKPGDIVEYSGYVMRPNGDGVGGMRLEFFEDADAAEPISSDISNMVIGAPEWVECKARATAPTGATLARVGCMVTGDRPQFRFDDVSVAIVGSASAPEPVSVTQLGFTWTVRPDGTFALTRGDAPVFARGDWLFANSSVRLGVLNENTRGREIARQGAMIELSGSMCDAFGRYQGATETPFVVKFAFDESGPTIEFAPRGSVSFQTIGIALVSASIDLSRPIASMVTKGEKTQLRFPQLTHRDILFTRMVVPMYPEWVAVSSRREASSTAEFEASTFRQRLLVRQGSNVTFAFAEDLARMEFETLRDGVATDLELGRQGDALAKLLSMLKLELHDPEAVRTIADQVRVIAARFDYLIREFQDSLERLKSSDDPALYRDATIRGDELQRVLGSALSGLDLAFLNNIDAPDLEQDFASIRGEIQRLRNEQQKIGKFYSDRKSQIDASTLARWENDSLAVIARAIDFDDAELNAMAIAAYREILDDYPFSRVATAARLALMALATSLKQEGDRVSDTQRALAHERYALALAIARDVLKDTWTPVSTTSQDMSFWEAFPGTFKPEALEMARHFLPESWRPTAQPLGDYRRDWRTWTRSEWITRENGARTAAESLLQAIGTIPPLPDPLPRRPD